MVSCGGTGADFVFRFCEVWVGSALIIERGRKLWYESDSNLSTSTSVISPVRPRAKNNNSLGMVSSNHELPKGAANKGCS